MKYPKLKFSSLNFKRHAKLNVCECVRKVISPILANIYLDKFDKYVKDTSNLSEWKRSVYPQILQCTCRDFQ